MKLLSLSANQRFSSAVKFKLHLMLPPLVIGACACVGAGAPPLLMRAGASSISISEVELSSLLVFVELALALSLLSAAWSEMRVHTITPMFSPT